MKLASVSACEQYCAKASIGFVHHQPGWYAASDASRRATAMDLSVARLHHAEMAFGIDNLAFQRDGSNVTRRVRGDAYGHVGPLGPRHNLQHSVRAELNECAVKPHRLSGKSFAFESVLARCYEQVRTSVTCHKHW